MLLDAVMPVSLPGRKLMLTIHINIPRNSHLVKKLKWERQSDTQHGDHINLHSSHKESMFRIRHIPVNTDIHYAVLHSLQKHITPSFPYYLPELQELYLTF